MSVDEQLMAPHRSHSSKTALCQQHSQGLGLVKHSQSHLTGELSPIVPNFLQPIRVEKY